MYSDALKNHKKRKRKEKENCSISLLRNLSYIFGNIKDSNFTLNLESSLELSEITKIPIILQADS